MYSRLLAWIAAPAGKAILLLAALLAPVVTYYVGKTVGWSAGFEAGKLDQIAEYMRLYNEKDAEVAQLNLELKAADEALVAAKDTVKERVVYRVREVEKIVHENPTFAAVVRPAELDALRLRELREIDEAARSPKD